MSNQQEWNEYFHLWRWEGCTDDNPAGVHCDDWPLYESSQAKTALFERAQSFRTLPAVSSFSRAFVELKKEGVLKPLRSKDPLAIEPEETLTVAEYNRLPASEIVRRYRTEKVFRSNVDALIAQGLI